MKVSYAFTITFVVKLFMMGSSFSNGCNSTSECEFHGECIDGGCACRQNCDEYGVVFLCGSDGKYHLNFCYLMMASCQNQQEIKIVSLGIHNRCHSLTNTPSKNLSSDGGNRRAFCKLKDNPCQNYGICVFDETSHCLCSNGFEGERCEFRKDNDEEKELPSIRRHYRGIMTNQNPRKTVYQDEAILVAFCALSAMFSAIVTSSICYRIRNKRRKHFRQHLIFTMEHNRGNKEGNICDSRIDPNIFQNTKLSGHMFSTFGKKNNKNCVNRIYQI